MGKVREGRKRGREGEGCVMAFGGWTPLSIIGCSFVVSLCNLMLNVVSLKLVCGGVCEWIFASQTMLTYFAIMC